MLLKYDVLSDVELLDLIKSGDHKAFEKIYERYWEPLLKHAYLILEDRDLCMDILQEVFVWLWSHRELLEIVSLKAYLFAAVKFQVANHLRNVKVREKYVGYLCSVLEESPISNATEVKELAEIIEHNTMLLPEKCREVFILSRRDNKSYTEIASIMNISVKTVEMHISLALRKLRLGLREYLTVIYFFLSNI